MHDPITGSRRRQNVEPPAPKKPAKPKPEIRHEPVLPDSPETQEAETGRQEEKVTLDFDTILKNWHGKTPCPNCGQIVLHGKYGHLCKCLRTWTSNNGSQTTT